MDPHQPNNSARNNGKPGSPSNSQQVHVHARTVNIGDSHYYSNKPPLDVGKAENDLRQSLHKMIQLMTDLKESESLPIQVAKQDQPQQEAFGKRSWLNESSNADNIQFYDMYKLFEESNECSRKQADQTCASQNAKEDFIRKTGNAVGASGIAGIGKTTMTKLIAKNTSNVSPVRKPPLIFFVSLRDIDASKPCSVLQFLTSSMLSDWDHTRDSDIALLKVINEADDVHIFTDAMDEAKGMNFKEVAHKMSLYDIATPDVIFKNLYSGHLLPKAKKLLSSRPGAFHDLHPDYKPKFSVAVLGLSKLSQELLCERICKNAADAEKVKAIFASNPSFSSLCFIPMFCRMTILYLLQNINSDAPLLSSSDMFTFSLSQCVSSVNFTSDVSRIQNLTRLALDGFSKEKFTFDVTDLQAADVDNATIDVFMNIDVVGNQGAQFKILDGSKRYYFSHVLWQKYFSAIFLLFFLSNDQFNDFYQHFSKESWYSVVKFMLGLSNPLVMSKMQTMFPQISADNLSQKRDVLKSFVQTAMHQYCDTEVYSYPLLAFYAEASCFSEMFKFLLSTACVKLFVISSWVYELQDVEVSKFIADLLPNEIPLRGSILPSDVTSLCHLLSNTPNIRSLSIGNWGWSVQFVGDGLKILLHNIHGSPHKLKKLHVKNQVIDMNDFTHILNDIEELSFDFCNLLLDDVQQIFQALQPRLIPIDYLSLSGNQILSSSIKDCVLALPKIRALELQSCNLSEDFIRQLANAIKYLESPMTSLDLSRNQVGRSGLENLSRCIHNIQWLALVDCKLIGNDVVMLTNKIAELIEPMKRLELDQNKIGSSGVESLSRCIHNVQSLSLPECNLTDDDIGVLSNKIKDLEQPMKLLYLSKNIIGSIGLRYLCRCIHNMQHLLIEDCELTGEQMEELSAAILRRHQPMESLQIDENKIEDNGAIAISRCLHKIKLLTIVDCSLSEKGVEALRSTNARSEQDREIFGLDHQ